MEAVARLKQGGSRVILITNQSAIARGLMAEADLDRIRYVGSVLTEDGPQAFDPARHAPLLIEALRAYREAGWRVIVVSNQAGIARGMMSEEDLEAVHRRMRAEAEAAGGRIETIYYCPHHWDEGCDCRKPRPGMLFQAQRDFHLDLTRVTFVGDDERDRQAADAAGCRSAMVTEAGQLVGILTTTDACRLLARRLRPP